MKVDASITLMNYKNINPILVPYVEENRFLPKTTRQALLRMYVSAYLFKRTSIDFGGKKLFMIHTVPTYVLTGYWFVFY